MHVGALPRASVRPEKFEKIVNDAVEKEQTMNKKKRPRCPPSTRPRRAVGAQAPGYHDGGGAFLNNFPAAVHPFLVQYAVWCGRIMVATRSLMLEKCELKGKQWSSPLVGRQAGAEGAQVRGKGSMLRVKRSLK